MLWPNLHPIQGQVNNRSHLIKELKTGEIHPLVDLNNSKHLVSHKGQMGGFKRTQRLKKKTRTLKEIFH